MSKKVILTIATLVLAITLSGIGVSCGPSEPTQFVTYTDEANRFSIDYPQGWHIRHPSNPPQLKVSIWLKQVGTNQACILVGKYEAPGYSFEAFSEFRMQDLLDRNEGYAPISTDELTINGIPAKRHTFTETVTLISFRIVEVYLVENGTGWILRFAAPQKSFDSYESTCNTVLNSFRLLK